MDIRRISRNGREDSSRGGHSTRPQAERSPVALRHNAIPLHTRSVDGVVLSREKLNMAPQRLRPADIKAIAVRWYRKSQIGVRRVRRYVVRVLPDMSPRMAFSLSLVVGVAFGVVLTSVTFRSLDRGASADVNSPLVVSSEPVIETSPEASDVFLEFFSEAAVEEYEAKSRDMVAGYPIEAMLPYIYEKDRVVQAFLIGIAKKESNWGKRVPVLEGQDCYNYWGYRGVRRLMGTGGHTCFNSRKDAVDTVARRIEKLVHSEKLNTPEKMILWKCGFSCAGHSRESVKKWISDVDMYFSELKEE